MATALWVPYAFLGNNLFYFIPCLFNQTAMINQIIFELLCPQRLFKNTHTGTYTYTAFTAPSTYNFYESIY